VLQSVREEVRERGTDASDASPVVRIKEALRHLREEVCGMDRDLGIVGGELLRYHRRFASASHENVKAKHKKRRQKLSHPASDDYSISDEF